MAGEEEVRSKRNKQCSCKDTSFSHDSTFFSRLSLFMLNFYLKWNRGGIFIPPISNSWDIITVILLEKSFLGCLPLKNTNAKVGFQSQRSPLEMGDILAVRRGQPDDDTPRWSVWILFHPWIEWRDAWLRHSTASCGSWPRAPGSCQDQIPEDT